MDFELQILTEAATTLIDEDATLTVSAHQACVEEWVDEVVVAEEVHLADVDCSTEAADQVDLVSFSWVYSF